MKSVKYVCFFFVLFTLSCSYRYQQRWLKENIWDLSYEGAVVKKFREPTRRDQPMYLLSDGNAYLYLNGNAFEYAAPGDSITKKAGTLKFHLTGRDTAFDFYPEYAGIEIKDSEVKDLDMESMPLWKKIFYY